MSRKSVHSYIWIVLWIRGPFATAPPAEEGLGAAVRPSFHERAQLDHHGKSAGSGVIQEWIFDARSSGWA